MTIYRDGGKGDFPRKVNDQKQYESNWDAIFNKKNKTNDKQSTIPTSTTNNEKNLQQTD